MRGGGYWLALCSLELLGVTTEKGEGRSVTQSLWAAMTKIPQTGWLKRENFLSDSSHNPGSWESKIKAPIDPASGERVKALLLVHRWCLLTVSSHEKGKEGGGERGFS